LRCATASLLAVLHGWTSLRRAVARRYEDRAKAGQPWHNLVFFLSC